MALWQFTVIAVLMGALLVHTSFLTLKMGRASAALKRIEDALLWKGEVVTPAPTAPVEAAQPLEPTDMEDSAARYLTIRDLKVRSERRRSHATASLESPAAPDMNGKFASLLFGRAKNESPDAASLEGGDTPNISAELTSLHTSPAENENSAPTGELPSLHASPGESETAVPASSETSDTPNTSTELPNLRASPGEPENSTPANWESGDAPNASTEPPHSPAASPTVSEDSVEQKERDALLFMSSQRRRRRARQGY
jgi:hypothetical protein